MLVALDQFWNQFRTFITHDSKLASIAKTTLLTPQASFEPNPRATFLTNVRHSWLIGLRVARPRSVSGCRMRRLSRIHVRDRAIVGDRLPRLTRDSVKRSFVWAHH